MLVLLWGFMRIQHAIAERNTAVAEEQKERELLSTTLSSIGDCVIVTDVEGRITFMNPVAINVTGWSEGEAIGRPLKAVFRIVNEETRQPVEDPVEKVIRDGVIVGLANHTLLIRRDNTEIPIDDSGAPVRSSDGKLQGVVLVFRDFSDTKHAQREILAAKEAAEKASRAKDTFLAMLSHELRTPLTPVLATVQAWGLAKDVPEPFRRQVYMLRRNLELEARLIDDLLDLTRISRGVLGFHPEVVDVHAIIHLLEAISRSDVLRKQINLGVKLEAKRRFVNTDPSRLQQVLWNILRNAVNYTDEHGRVLFETADDGDSIEITVTDNGVGMTAETIQRLFTPFEQADRTRSVRYGGLGVGLAISHALVEQMGGEIVASSAGLGRGSRFTVRLRTVAEESAAIAPRSPGTSEAPQARSILLVEDHADTSFALSRLLQLRGHQVRTAASTTEAEAEFAAHPFDLLLCDIGLPDGTGYDFIKHVRERSGIAAIAVTGFGMQSDVDHSLAAGFDAHVTKPIDLFRLESAIATSDRRAQARGVALG
jgi:PAS domain S-box-containing protein